MNFIKTDIEDVIICKPEIYEDDRGYFVENFREDKLEKILGYRINFCQDNESKSSYGTLRGLHYQIEPNAQTKLVRVVKGEIIDVAVDIRKNSPTFGKHIKVELNEKNKKQLLIPAGFAHGFLVKSNEAIVCYKVDKYYSSDHDKGILFSDPELNIDWGMNIQKLKISNKDRNLPLFKDHFNKI